MQGRLAVISPKRESLVRVIVSSRANECEIGPLYLLLSTQSQSSHTFPPRFGAEPSSAYLDRRPFAGLSVRVGTAIMGNMSYGLAKIWQALLGTDCIPSDIMFSISLLLSSD